MNQYPVATTPSQSYIATTLQTPKIPQAYRKGKSGQQLDIILGALLNLNYYKYSFSLRTNQLGTRYCIQDFQFIFFDSPEFEDKLKAFVIKSLLIREPSQTAIKNTLLILRESPEYWLRDSEECSNPCIRVINHGYPNIYYVANPNNTVQLTTMNYEPRFCGFAALMPNEAKWDWNMTLSDNFGDQKLQDLRQAPELYTTNLLALLKTANIPEDRTFLVISWLAHCLLSSDHIILELIGEDSSIRHYAHELIKQLLDPSNDPIKVIPKKHDELFRIGLEEYLISLRSNLTRKLSDEYQSTLLEMITNNGARGFGNDKNKEKTRCFIKRPFSLSAPDTLITNHSLQSHTLTINLPDTSKSRPPKLDHQLLNHARIELLRLTKAVSYCFSPSWHEKNFTIGKNAFPEMESLLLIGCELSELLRKNKNSFMHEFEAWAVENSFMQLENNDTAFLLYLWASENPETSIKRTISEWKKILLPYAQDENIDLSSVEARKIGADLKQARSLFKKLGIDCEYAGRGRLSYWTISVGTTIGFQESLMTKS
ncbi:hypothetical protein [Hydrogenovibrio marinus]|uniref:Uncharacterized protein n=1 Tax=Hydrogenovibrio marinus TaxID=28885 RepID=A0A066ZVC0_HYDMR|nr:hypothetical protein [Hydrogenovibrio marinus]KDN96189.1 hypothetical protein EI16_07840 [Hydrogenovibrio marinus]BBN60633.1 hypothetical protein HVMH_2227 [Hydrogenovibrio marinus]